jgi:hypothetical protein
MIKKNIINYFNISIDYSFYFNFNLEFIAILKEMIQFLLNSFINYQMIYLINFYEMF